MFASRHQSDVDIVAPDGTLRQRTKALITTSDIILPDPKALISVGDEIRRKLPNGLEDTFEVTSTMYYDGTHGIPAHHQIKFRQKGAFPKGTGGNYTFNVSGPNARVNFNSVDYSNNIVDQRSLFREIVDAVDASTISQEEKWKLKLAISSMEAKANDRDAFLSAYQDFMIVAATHVTVLAPFLPALSRILS